MSVALLLIRDGRTEELSRTLGSALLALPKFDQYIDVDDSDHELGFAGAIAEGWKRVETDWVLHLEQDFIFNRPAPVEGMIALLERRPYLAQVSLKRQPWNAEEREAGGIVECNPRDFEEKADGRAVWAEHRRYWTTNPAVYSSSYCRRGWPQVPESEGYFTHLLLEDPDLRFAIWGGKYDEPMVEHIGRERAGLGY